MAIDEDTRRDAKETWKTYHKRQGYHSFIPKDPYSHQASLLYPHNLSVEEFGDLLNQHLLLGNVEDEVMLQLYQEEIYFITSVFAMTKKEPALITDVFNLMYYPFVMSIRLTSILDGTERKMQGFTFQNVQKRRSRWQQLTGKRPKKKEYIPYQDYYH